MADETYRLILEAVVVGLKIHHPDGCSAITLAVVNCCWIAGIGIAKTGGGLGPGLPTPLDDDEDAFGTRPPHC